MVIECEFPEDTPPNTAWVDAPPPGGAWVERTDEWGLDFVHQDGALPEKHLPETMGAGAVLFDCDGDLDLDLYLVQGGPMRLGAGPGKFVEPPGELPPDRLYLNDGSGHFRDATAASGAAAHTGYGMGALAADFDGDGHQDLFVTNLGADALFLGDGQGSFRDASRAAGVDDPRWTAGAVAFDADGDRDVDLFVTAYLEVDLSAPLWCGDRRPGWRSVCHPDAYTGLPDRFYRNRGDGTFEDATAAAGFGSDTGNGLGAMAFDVEGDGDLDVFVANDSNGNRMWFNRGDGTFEDGTLISATGVDGYGRTEASMGLAFGDVDGDLLPEIFLTGFDAESDTLYKNLGGGGFRDGTAQAGLEAPTRLPVGFGATLSDFDHDGDLDIVIANGHIIHNIHLYHDGKAHAQRAQAYENDGSGRFRELGPQEI
ncbi:MAG: VCBS repeat-containing protein, partial [Chloroflexi bacterium]|nr:VCBS repeat-containing protein [Chloroflexota bacterium]